MVNGWVDRVWGVHDDKGKIPYLSNFITLICGLVTSGRVCFVTYGVCGLVHVREWFGYRCDMVSTRPVQKNATHTHTHKFPKMMTVNAQKFHQKIPAGLAYRIYSKLADEFPSKFLLKALSTCAL